MKTKERHQAKTWLRRLVQGREFPLLMSFGVFIIGLLLSGAVRYRSGLNQSPLHLRLSNELQRSDVKITIRSLRGSLDVMKFISHHNQKIWTTLSSRPPVTGIFISSPIPPEANEIELRCGTSWNDYWKAIRPLRVEKAPGTQPNVYQLMFQQEPPRLLRRFSEVVNWQGDMWLVLVPLCHAILMSAVTYMIVTCFVGVTEGSVHLDRRGIFGKSISGVWGCTSAIFVFAMMIAVYGRLLHVNGGREFLWSVGVACSVIGGLILIWKWSMGSWVKERPRMITSLLIAGSMVLLCVKMMIVHYSSVVAVGDFKDYATLGERFVDGTSLRHWDAEYALLPILARRAYSFAAPVIWLFGPGKSLAFTNCVLQLLTSWLIGAVAMSGGTGVAAAGVAAGLTVLLWPDFLYSTVLPSHDISGFFWMSCAFGIVARLQFLMQAGCWVSVIRTARVFIWTVALGFCMNMIEWTRGFTPFFICGILFASVVHGRRHSYGTPNNGSVKLLLVVLLSMGSMVVFSQLFKADFLKKVGPSPTSGYLEYVAAVSTKSDGTWSGMHPFRFNYWPQIPTASRMDFFIRKIVHEKLVRLREFPEHLWRKIQHLSRNDDYPYLVLAGEDTERMAFGVHGLHFHTVLADVLCFVLLSVLLAGILIAFVQGLSFAEYAVFSVAYAILFAVLFLTEVAGTYDCVLGVACAVAVPRVLSTLTSEARSVHGAGNAVQIMFRSVGRYGLVPLVTVLTLAYLAGLFVAKGHRTFVDCRSVGVKFDGDSEQFSVSVDDVGVRLSCRSRRGQTDDEATGAVYFTVPGERQEKIRLFLSANQYADARPEMVRFPPGAASFQLTAGGRRLAAGDLSELNSPKWIEFERGDVCLCELRLNFRGGSGLELKDDLPVVSVEYIWSGR